MASQIEQVAQAIIQVGRQSGPVQQALGQVGRRTTDLAVSLPNDETGFSRRIRTELYAAADEARDALTALDEFGKTSEDFARRLIGQSGGGGGGHSSVSDEQESSELSSLPRKPVGSTGEDDHDADVNVANRTGWESRDPSYRVNCQKCVTAYELRRRGYDVVAQPTQNGQPLVNGTQVGQRANYITGRWTRPDGNRPGQLGDGAFRNRQDLDAQVVSWGIGGRGFVMVRWKGRGDGHVFIAENRGGKATYTDPQSGSLDATGYFDRVDWRKPNGVCILRVDNLIYDPDGDAYKIDDMVKGVQ